MAKSKKSLAAPKEKTAKPSGSSSNTPDLGTLLSGAPATRAQWRSVVIRVRYLHQEIRAGHYPNATHMKEKFGIERSTVGRDVAAMRDSMNLPVVFDFKRNGYYYTHEVPADLPRPRMSPGEALSFCLARRALERFRGTGFAQQFTDSLTRITSEVEGDIPFEWDELDRLVSFGGSNRDTDSSEKEISDGIARALGSSEEIEISYWKRESAGYEFRRVQPLHLRLHDDTVYLLAYALDRTDGKVRTFVLSRIAEVRLTGQKFERPADFDPDEVFRHSIGIYGGDKPEHLRLRLSPFLTRWFAERPLHATQQITMSGNGSAELTIEVAITPELEGEILRWGLEVEVVEPAELKEKVLATARGILARAEAS